MTTVSIATPNVISDVVYHSVTERQRIADIATGAYQFPCNGKNSILLWGEVGTGKTTLARLLPEAIEQGKGGSNAYYDFIRCAQGLTGPVLMQTINKRAILMSSNYSGLHYFVLDEVDNLTKGAQASLKSVMSIPSTVYILTTNYVGKVDNGVQNRSVRINCNAGPAADYLPFARQAIVELGGQLVDDAKLLPIIERCNGSLRDITDALQSVVLRQRMQKLKAA
jgi:DNA polymerase III delta prime subunit